MGPAVGFRARRNSRRAYVEYWAASEAGPANARHVRLINRNGGCQGDCQCAWGSARRGRALRAVDHGALEHREPVGRGGVRARQGQQGHGVLAGGTGVEDAHHVLEP